jgi:hypothetical protein
MRTRLRSVSFLLSPFPFRGWVSKGGRAEADERICYWFMVVGLLP